MEEEEEHDFYAEVREVLERWFEAGKSVDDITEYVIDILTNMEPIDE